MTPRRMTPAQMKSALQKAQRDTKRAVDNYNRAVNQYNANVRKAVNDYNREVRNYNAKARLHNQKVVSQRRRLDQEIRRLQSQPATGSFTVVRTSTTSFVTAYGRAETRLAAESGPTREYLDLASDEAANSVYLLNALYGDGDPATDMTEDELASPSLLDELMQFGTDLVSRWTGALYALSPRNPDAARHFCTSAREVVISILDKAAPDGVVVSELPGCEMHDKTSPTRRAKVTYLLRCKGVDSEELADAIAEDVDNVLSLFKVFNDGTHGHAGRFSITELTAIRTRVEGAVSFLARLVAT